MDWRHPNVACLFHRENIQQTQTRDYTRYARSVKNPPLYGLCMRDYDTDHKPREWPSGTEYQFAYCSNYRALKQPLCDTGLDRDTENAERGFLLRETSVTDARPGDNARCVPFYKLYEVTPSPIIDKHYRGAKYMVDDPIGVRVPEELSRNRVALHGPIRLSCQQDLQNVYTPNYRYKEWISRPMYDIYKELDQDIFFCRLPETPSQYWDFYNVVRMNRPAKTSTAIPNFQPCPILPFPMDKNMPDPPPVSANPHLGKFNNYQNGNVSNSLLGQC